MNYIRTMYLISGDYTVKHTKTFIYEVYVNYSIT